MVSATPTFRNPPTVCQSVEAAVPEMLGLSYIAEAKDMFDRLTDGPLSEKAPSRGFGPLGFDHNPNWMIQRAGRSQKVWP